VETSGKFQLEIVVYGEMEEREVLIAFFWDSGWI
jgi:hypothetical protein